MKSKGLAMCAMIAVWCIAGLFLFNGFLVNRAAAQSRAEPINVQWEKIGVMPFFKGRRSADAGETLTCPLCELSFRFENIKEDADRALTHSVQEVLERRYRGKVIAMEEVSRVYQEISRDDAKDTPRSLAQKAGEVLGADLMIVGTVWRYRDRIRYDMGLETGASVAFEIYLIDVPSGKTVWKQRFDETQRPLTEDIRGAKVLLKKGARWLTADELACYGVEEVFKKFPL
jgi:TolB-like protein